MKRTEYISGLEPFNAQACGITATITDAATGATRNETIYHEHLSAEARLALDIALRVWPVLNREFDGRSNRG